LSAEATDPFYIIVTARTITTPHSNQPITLATHLSPLHVLQNSRAFQNITCTTNTEKTIQPWLGWPHYIWDREDLNSSWTFVTIPSPGQGSWSVRHEIRRDMITAANVQKGEKYRVAISNKCLGTRWWTFVSLKDLEGVRLRTWETVEESSMRVEELEIADSKHKEDMERADPESREEIEYMHKYLYGNRWDGPVTMGEDPFMLAMVLEIGEVEFEIV